MSGAEAPLTLLEMPGPANGAGLAVAANSAFAERRPGQNGSKRAFHEILLAKRNQTLAYNCQYATIIWCS